MKRVNLFFIAAFVAASSLLIVSCGEDDDEDAAPKITVSVTYGNNAGAAAIKYTTDATVSQPEGTAVGIDVTVEMGKSKVEHIKFTSKIGSSASPRTLVDIDKSGVFTSAIKTWTYSSDLDPNTDPKVPYGLYYTNVGNLSEVLTFNAIDSKKREATVVITLAVEVPDVPAPEPGDSYSYYSLAETNLGAQSNAMYGSFYNAGDGKVMFQKEAGASPASITLVAYYGSGPQVTSPTSAVSGGSFSYNSQTLSKWAGKVETKLKKSENTIPEEGRDDWWAAGLADITATEVTVAVGDFVFFKQGSTEGVFKEGVFKVVSVPANASGAFVIQFYKRKAN